MLQGAGTRPDLQATSAREASVLCESSGAVLVRLAESKEADHFLNIWDLLVVHAPSHSCEGIELWHVRGTRPANTHAVQASLPYKWVPHQCLS